jgi:thioredoxin-like negative regulator of GroEL
MYFDSPSIHYLETSDFDSSYRLQPNTSPTTGRPVFAGMTIVMLQGNFCGYCTQFKPAFTKVAHQIPGVDFATIQTDSSLPGEQFSPTLLKNILKTEMKGVPMVVKFIQGSPVDVYTGPRTDAGLRVWIAQ